jgi:large subunit ribosomal protein L13
MSKTSYFTKESRERPWYVVDLDGQVLGRAAAAIASLLIGKTQPQYTPGQDTGGFVIAINAAKIKVTGNKAKDKVYYTHSGYPGGIKSKNYSQRISTEPTEVIRDAVKGMLPKNKLGARLITKLKIYSGADHPHAAQQANIISAEQLGTL